MSQPAVPGMSFCKLPPEMRDSVYAFIFETHRISRVHVKRNSRSNYDAKERFTCSSRILSADKTCHKEFYDVLEKYTFTSATAIVIDVTDLDFRSTMVFLKTLKSSERAQLMRPDAPKLVVRLELIDVRAFDGVKLASWLAFSSKCGLTFEYEVGEMEEPEVVFDYFMRLMSLSDDANYLKIATSVRDAKEGVKKSVARGSLLSSLIGPSEEDDADEESDEAEEEEGESDDESDQDSENMSSEEDFTDEEDEAADGVEGDE